MSPMETVRAWRDEDYLMSLSDEARTALPENPAGDVRFHHDPDEGFNVVTFAPCHRSIVLECSASNCG
jgi:mersacidin/lichenicidin family type 2 lantibiotic